MENEKENEEEKQNEDILDFTKPDFIFTAKGNHIWKQGGPYLMCSNCELQHAVYIGTEKIMTGIDTNGDPILKGRKELGMS